MSNCCLNDIVFYTDNENLFELHRLRRALLKVEESGSEVAGNNGNLWLGNVAHVHGIDSEARFCRGEIDEIFDIDEKSCSFLLTTTTAWNPLSELWEEVCKSYKGINFVYSSEEAGEGIYVNTDAEGTFIARRYKIGVTCDQIDKPLPTGYFAKGIETWEVYSDNTYYANFKELAEYMKRLTGKAFRTHADIERYLREALIAMGIEDAEVSVHMFEYE